jgi:hypothetical protein
MNLTSLHQHHLQYKLIKYDAKFLSFSKTFLCYEMVFHFDPMIHSPHFLLHSIGRLLALSGNNKLG